MSTLQSVFVRSLKPLAIILSVLVAGDVLAGVFDDAAVWIKGFRDTDSDGLLGSAEDIPDARNAGASINCVLYGEAASRFVREENVDCPYSARAIKSVPCCYLSQPTDETGLGIFSSFGLLESSGERIAATNGVSTFLARVRPESPVTTTVWLSGGYGSQVGFTKQTDGTLRLRTLAVTNTSYAYQNSSIYFETNTWIEIAVVRDESAIRFYAITNGSDFLAQSVNVASTPDTTYKDLYFANYGEGRNSSTTKPPYNNSFRGSIHQIAFWNRALSEQEVREAFAYPACDIFRLGVADGSATEFGKKIPDGLVVNPDNWYSAPASLSNDVSVSYAFRAGSESASLTHYLRLTSTAASEAGALAVTVNGAALDPIKSFPGKVTSTFLPTGVLVAGDNTLVLTRTTGGATEIDALSLGGSFQLGTDNNSYAEFSASGSNPAYAEDGNPSHAVNAVGCECTNEMKFIVSPDSAGVHRWQFTVKTYTPNALSYYANPAEAGLLVNGILVSRETFDIRYKEFTVKLPADALHVGENTLGFVNFTPFGTDKGYLCMDYWRLCPLKPLKGTVVSVR